MFLESSQPRYLSVYFITEAELDAILIHHTSGGIVGSVAVRTNRGKPDARCNPSLEAAVRVCVALDYDEAGAVGCDFWEMTYPNSLRWPTPEGKDPGDAFALGVDIHEWIAASLPDCVLLPEQEDAAPARGTPHLYDSKADEICAVHRSSITQDNEEIQAIAVNGQTDTTASGQINWGEGENPKTELDKGSWPSIARARLEARAMAQDYNMEVYRWKETQPSPLPWASENDFTPEELELLKRALPPETNLDDIYLDVAVIWLLWRNTPITFIGHCDDEDNRTGFKWDWDYAWETKNQEQFDLFWRHQYTSRALWQWLSDHPAEKINSRNLLHMWRLLAEKSGE